MRPQNKSGFAFLPILALCFVASVPALAAQVSWHLYPSWCTGGSGAVQFACGDYGRFVLQQTAAPPGCGALAFGAEIPPGFPSGPAFRAFPVHPRKLGDLVPVPAPAPAPSAGTGRPRLGRGETAPVAVTTPRAQQIQRWIAVVDFDNPHGESTTWLAGRVAGPSVASVLASLDDAALNVLGAVSDFHVLARLCEIAQVADSGNLPPPVTINMSFGRPARAIDPISAASCPANNAACQIAQVVLHLKTRGSSLVAAAGNHRESLFPAALEDVIAAGMLDLTPFFQDRFTRPAWETPPAVDAWLPGNALCLDSWAAPAGSSYSSAMLAGWLVETLDHPEVLRTLGAGPWLPAWDNLRQCFVLAKGRRSTPWCNAAITTLFAGLSNRSTGGCGTGASEPSLAPRTLQRAATPAPLPSLDIWGDPTHPAPESDPCVPCTGNVIQTTGGSDLRLDLSSSGPLPNDIHLDEVSLRVGDGYYALDLSDVELAIFEDAGVATLVIPGAGELIPPAASVSLWYRMKEIAGVECSSTNECFWSSTPLLLGP